MRREDMHKFLVRFHKKVLGSNGHEVEICQSWLEVNAPNEVAAAELAKRNFCTKEGVPHWLVHADRIEVKEADFPS